MDSNMCEKIDVLRKFKKIGCEYSLSENILEKVFFFHPNINILYLTPSTTTYFSLSCTLIHTRGLDHDYFFSKVGNHTGRFKPSNPIAKLSPQKMKKAKRLYFLLYLPIRIIAIAVVK